MNFNNTTIPHRKAIATYVLTSVLYSFGDKIHGSNFTVFLHSRGLSFTYVGLIIGVIGIITALTDFPTGNIADKYGRKRAVSLGLFLYGLGLLLFLVNPITRWSFVAALSIGLGIAFCSGSLYAWIKSSLTQDTLLERTIIWAESLRWLGASLAGFCAMYLLSLNGKYTFLIGGIVLIIASLILYIFVPENYGNRTIGIFTFMRESYQELRNNKRLGILFVSSLLADVGLFTFIVAWQVLWLKAGNSHESLGLIFIFLTLSSAFGSLFMTKLTNKSEKAILIIALGIQSSSLLMIPFANNISTLIVSFLLFEAMIGLRGTCVYNMYIKLIPSSIAASCLSLLSTISGGIRFVAATTAGILIERSQFFIAFSLPAFCAFLGVGLILLFYLPLSSEEILAYEK